MGSTLIKSSLFDTMVEGGKILINRVKPFFDICHIEPDEYTFAELKQLATDGDLVAGQEYILTDYSLKFKRNDNTSVEKVSTLGKLTLKAKTNTTFHKKCTCENANYDTVYYDFTDTSYVVGSTTYQRNGLVKSVSNEYYGTFYPLDPDTTCMVNLSYPSDPFDTSTGRSEKLCCTYPYFQAIGMSGSRSYPFYIDASSTYNILNNADRCAIIGYNNIITNSQYMLLSGSNNRINNCNTITFPSVVNNLEMEFIVNLNLSAQSALMSSMYRKRIYTNSSGVRVLEYTVGTTVTIITL